MKSNALSVVFASNYYNHHQKYLSDALFRLTEGKYCFVETSRISQERLAMGWGGEEKPSYVKQTYTSEEAAAECRRRINEADVVIIGSAPNELVKERLKLGKLVFRYSERLLKKGLTLWKYPIRFVLWRMRNGGSKQVYMLCASAYTAGDYAKFGMYRNKCYQWGYFPQVKQYDDIRKKMELKHPASILWVARLIELKHPEAAIQVAARLKQENFSFSMRIVGNGVMENELKQMIAEQGLEEQVQLTGAMKPEQVREEMERAQIFMFTSDKNEGWGAVLNESMNSGCAVVASHAIGSVPFLLKSGENGLIYRDGDMDDLYEKVKFLLQRQDLCRQYGEKAYETITNVWCSDTAARRVLTLAEAVLNGEESPELFDNGPCSKAEILGNRWM